MVRPSNAARVEHHGHQAFDAFRWPLEPVDMQVLGIARSIAFNCLIVFTQTYEACTAPNERINGPSNAILLQTDIHRAFEALKWCLKPADIQVLIIACTLVICICLIVLCRMHLSNAI